LGAVSLDVDNNSIKINLANIPHEYHAIAFTCSIFDDGRSKNLSRINACIRLINGDSGDEILHYDCDFTDAADDNARVLGELYRDEAGWKFRVVDKGVDGGLAGLCRKFGVDVN
jgi:tellurium resistance protein TerD